MSSKKIENGRYWNAAWQLVDGCTPCSPGCDHCWSAAMARRFQGGWITWNDGPFKGNIFTHPERLSVPLKRRKPTVYSVWNDWAHENATHHFRSLIVKVARECPRHTILALTKRPAVALDFWNRYEQDEPPDNWWSGLTICNQQEADAKIVEFLKVPGKKFLSIEPMLGEIDLMKGEYLAAMNGGKYPFPGTPDEYRTKYLHRLDAVILGGETGPGARPMHPDWVRKVRDDCAAAEVPFFLKHLNKKDGRVLDGKTYDQLPWRAGMIKNAFGGVVTGGPKMAKKKGSANR